MKIEEYGVHIKIETDTSEMDEVMRKVEKLRKLMNEAMETANSIAQTKLNIPISAVFDGNATELASITTE